MSCGSNVRSRQGRIAVVYLYTTRDISCRLQPGASICVFFFFFFQAEDGIRDLTVTGVQTCALPISRFQHLRDALIFLDGYEAVEWHAVQAVHLSARPTNFKCVDAALPAEPEMRSEERRVGKECRSRWSPYH